MNKIKILFQTFAVSLVLSSCGSSDNTECKAKCESETKTELVNYDTTDVNSILAAMEQANGGIDALKALNDVSYEYHYAHPDGKKDISTEYYIFDGEVSLAEYSQHEINVAPDLEGTVVQYYDGNKAMISNNGVQLNNEALIGGTEFLRKANYFWFTMMYKLTDPGILANYEGRKNTFGTIYDVVSITYDPAITNKAMNDKYVLYINPETRLVEKFNFSLPQMGVNDPILLAHLTYEKIDGINVIVARKMEGPSPDGNGMDLMVDQQLKNIKFNTGLDAKVLLGKM